MLLQNPIPFKETTKLFNNKYKYKIVIISALSHWFRGENYEKLENRFKDPDHVDKLAPHILKQLKDEGGLALVHRLYKIIDQSNDFKIRVERPYLNIYSNDYTVIEKLSLVNPAQVKCIFKPADESILVQNTIISKRLDYAYKLSLGQTSQSHESFVNWCKDNPKVRVSKSTVTNLLRQRHYQPGYVYIKDDKTLTMVKMFLGGCIRKIERVIKA